MSHKQEPYSLAGKGLLIQSSKAVMSMIEHKGWH